MTCPYLHIVAPENCFPCSRKGNGARLTARNIRLKQHSSPPQEERNQAPAQGYAGNGSITCSSPFRKARSLSLSRQQLAEVKQPFRMQAVFRQGNMPKRGSSAGTAVAGSILRCPADNEPDSKVRQNRDRPDLQTESHPRDSFAHRRASAAYLPEICRKNTCPPHIPFLSRKNRRPALLPGHLLPQ